MGKGTGIIDERTGETIVSPESVRQIRMANNNVSDEEFEYLQKRAIETQVPLTRAALIKFAREKGRINSAAYRNDKKKNKWAGMDLEELKELRDRLTQEIEKLQ